MLSVPVNVHYARPWNYGEMRNVSEKYRISGCISDLVYGVIEILWYSQMIVCRVAVIYFYKIHFYG